MTPVRRRSLYLLAAVILVFLLVWGVRTVKARLLEGALERATGMSCSVGSAAFFGADARDVELASPSGVRVRLDRLRLWSSKKNLNLSGIKVFVPGNPGVEADLKSFRVGLLYMAPLLSSGQGKFPVLAGGQMEELTPLLREYGKVRAESGEFEVEGYAEVGPGGKLAIDLRVCFRDLLVRSLDGSFEFGAGEATATVRVTGTLKEPKLDLGELEPILGRKFVKSFEKLQP